METKIKEWVLKASQTVTKQTEGVRPMSLEIVPGRKYYKVICNTGGVFCFIDRDGNIYKPAGAFAPAKGIRGTVETIDPEKVTFSGGFLYRYK